MRSKSSPLGATSWIAGACALFLVTAPACFSDPGNMGDPDAGTDDTTDTSDTGGDDGSEDGSEDGTESGSEDTESDTSEPLPDMPNEDTGEPDPPECVWLRLGENLDDDLGAVTIDTWIDEENPTTNNGSDDDLRADGVSENGLTETTLVRFELSSLPDGMVTDALFVLATNGDEGSESSPGSQFSLHLMGEAWVEGEATWLQASQGIPWSVTGCAAAPCRGDTELAFFEPTEQEHAYELDLDPAIVEAWRADPSANHGLQLTTPASNGGHFHSSESKDETMRPALEIRVCPDE